jgi:hypothetical protein
MTYTISMVNLRTGECGEDVDSRIFTDLGAARAYLATLSAKRRATRKDNGKYSPIVHGIRRDPPAVNPQ